MRLIPAGYTKNERGATAVLVALVMLPLIAITALAIDTGHIYVVRNELQNAADAGALAAAQSLYLPDETQVNVGANLVGYNAATANSSESLPVEVNWSGGNGGDVERGHWSFADETFTPNASIAPVDLWDVTDDVLDANLDFINAVRVRTRREGIPAAAFFARIFGYEGFSLEAEAVAYLGFAGTLTPFDVDQPIAICDESIRQGGEYTCNVGRMINSGGDMTTHQTGGWTNFDQESACNGTNTSELRPLICSGNPVALNLGRDMGTNGGEIQAVFDDLIDCWERESGKAEPWPITLPVIRCPANNVGTCEQLVGAVEVNVIWITGSGEDPQWDSVPREMAGIEGGVSAWSCSSDTGGEACWYSFVTHFNLQNVDQTPVPYAKKSIYFLPDCTPHEPAGVTGGDNFGIRAQIPVLVQ